MACESIRLLSIDIVAFDHVDGPFAESSVVLQGFMADFCGDGVCAERLMRCHCLMDSNLRSEDMHDGMIVDGRLTIRNPYPAAV